MLGLVRVVQRSAPKVFQRQVFRRAKNRTRLPKITLAASSFWGAQYKRKKKTKRWPKIDSPRRSRFHTMQRHGQLKTAQKYIVHVASVSVHDNHRLAAIATKQRNSYNRKCSARRPDGNSCGKCVFCASEKMTHVIEDGLCDAWPEIIADIVNVRLVSVPHTLLFDYVTSPLLPGTPGAVFTPNVSQAVIFIPRGIDSFRSRIEIVTLTLATDYPLAASLPANAFAFYVPLGTGVSTITEQGVHFALSGVATTNIGSFSTTYASVADVPAKRVNALWFVAATVSTSTVTLFGTSMIQFTPDWQVETQSLVTSTIKPPSSSAPVVTAVPVVLDVAGVLPGGFWDLTRTSTESYQIVRPIYIKSVRGCLPRDQKCQLCISSRTQKCGGTRCGQRQAVFRVDNGMKYMHDNGELFSNHNPEVEMIKRCLRSKKASFPGITVDDQSSRIVCGTTGDDLVRVSREKLIRALEVAEALDAETGQDDIALEYPYRVFTSKSFGQRAMQEDRDARIKLIELVRGVMSEKIAAAKAIADAANALLAPAKVQAAAAPTPLVIPVTVRATRSTMDVSPTAEPSADPTTVEIESIVVPTNSLAPLKSTKVDESASKSAPETARNVTASILDGDLYSKSADAEERTLEAVI